ncbi:unnamed protein product [Rotaria socialis]
MRVITLYELELIDQSNGFDIILSPLPVINDEIRSSEQYKTIGRATRPLHISRSPVFERRRYDGRIAKTLTFDDTSNLNIRSICRSLRKRLESSKQNNHSNNQIENDLNEKSEETMSTSEKNVAKAQINAKENLELKLATQASAELKDDEKNKKWLARIWQTNMWRVADEVRNITHDFAVGSPLVVPKETGRSSALSNIINVIKICSQSEIITIDSSNQATNLNSSNARANEILDDILTLVNLKEMSLVCNKDSTSPKIQSSTTMNVSPQFIMNSPTKEVYSNEIALTTYRVTTVKDNMNWHQLDEIQDFHTSNEDKLFPGFDNIVMDEYQKTANKERQQTHENNKAGKQCVHNETERGVTPLTDEYRHIIDALLDRPAITGQYTSNIPSEPILLQIDKSDLDFFQILMMESKSKTNVIAVETPDGLIYLKNMYHKRMIGKIVHSPSEQRARPIRGTHRLSVAEKLTSGLSPDQLRLKEQGHLTENNRKFGNHNLVDSSPHILQKIKEEQAKLINVGKRVPGYLQTITISPLRLILFTEGALILWNKIGSNVPISWDATGRIVMSRGKRVYYYELTVTNIASRSVTTKNLSGPSFPITSMLSSTHTTMDLVRWSPIVHSDGSLVFQLTAMRFFNGDNTMSAYLKRSWIIVNRKATNEDLSKTVVHSCFAHFSKSVKLQATKFFTKKKVAFVLWTMSLLVNSNTVEEMASMWEHICAVLLRPTQITAYSVSISCLSHAADNVNNDSDKDNFIIRNVKVDSKGEYQYSSTLDQV